ncbi:MAG: flagellar hook-associated protein FlgK [Gammaproteobacteria bacterium HGW-Gammaproteobacteria-1]|jgi:flagellar hook-associated protein 1 FlgK|nr:MAG: flagellar hook-associated protein FlgK [Gammaproteobacteria bacterium HGW-Gammaproteobacteria-1]
MPDILSTGVSGLLAFQRALATTSHNISNVNTEGYSRQRTNLSTRIPEPTGAGFIGSGVRVSSVERLYDQFLSEQLRTQTSGLTKLDAFHKLSSQVDNLLADADAGMAPALQEFFNALQGVADNPSSIPAREVLLSQAESVAHRFQTIDQRLAGLRDVVNASVTNTVNDINTLSQSIATVNQSIVLALAQSGGQPPNDLLDQRDLLVRQLAERVPVTTVEQDNGAMNVFIGNGQVMVLGTDYNQLDVVPSDYDSFTLQVALHTSAGPGPDVTNFLNGGTIGGLLSFRKEVLEPAQNALGRIAIGLAETINAQHGQGLDLNNQLGSDFFGFGGVTAQATAAASSRNLGVATVSYSITDATALTASDYRISTADGINYTLTRLSDNSVVGTYAPGAYPATISVPSEGFSFSLDVAAAAGDSFELRPTRAAARDITLLIDDTKAIAAAAPLRATESVANLGSANISALDTTATATTDLAAVLAGGNVTMTYDSAIPGYTLGGALAGTLAYDPATESAGKTFDLGAIDPDYSGITFRLSGVPLDGDSFTISANYDGVGDNGNALKLAAIDGTPILSGGTTTFQNAYGQMVSQVGARTHQAGIDLGAQETLVTQAEMALESVSGVNLDEEAANMLKYQQAYQATAQIITIAQSLFDTLLNAVRS